MARPAKYDPKLCDALIKHFEQGYTYDSFAGKIRVARQTLYNWEENYPEWKEAKEIGFLVAQYAWETISRDIAITGEGNATIAMFRMQNQFPDSFRDKRHIDHTSKGDKIEIPITTWVGNK